MAEKYNKKIIIQKVVSHVCADAIAEIGNSHLTFLVRQYLLLKVDANAVDIDKILPSEMLEARDNLVTKLKSMVLPTKQKEE